jgi:CxxC motif-containing protein (DUF1111 family)
MFRLTVLALSLLLSADMALGANDVTVPDAGREAYSHPVSNLSESDLERFYNGRALFHQVWVIAPSHETTVDGLGPLYNQFSCSACHARNGYGHAPGSPDERMQSMLVRLSISGTGAHGGPMPSPLYGDQLNEQGIPGVTGEGRVTVRWEEMPFRFDDGETVALRRPDYAFTDMAFGKTSGMLFSPRVAPPVYGTGLLDAVPASALLAMAAEHKPDGVKGKVNWVWDDVRKKTVVGKFGLKDNTADLTQQIAAAFIGDMGITSPLHRMQNCTAHETDCRRAYAPHRLEVTQKQLSDIVFYVANLAVPARRNIDDPKVISGAALFAANGCAVCHRPELKTAATTPFPTLADHRIYPYSDMLLHDMGAELADGRPDFRASGREWRTPPLWGIGLAESINPGAGFLHDGRARTLQEAILWHGGEAGIARERYAHLSAEERNALLAFLQSL